ncbi:collagen alpha-1(XII) chain-like [Erpetoichthys calabaricus]|uniref:collagen alpha-1(XII) chain-like n=1 Tax=Erpetoichthys calabaricus TaxID=27687 RepID=UPI00223407A3|nr:collagen alpha-1(XII) chain-like [Erpetoichthys calabaricus]
MSGPLYLGTTEVKNETHIIRESFSFTIEATARSPTSIFVYWTSLTSTSMTVFGYEIQYMRVGDNSSVVIRTNNTQHLLQDLLPSTTYSISVTPLYNNARGIPGSLTITTPNITSSYFINIFVHNKTATSAELSWQVPAQIASNIMMYRLCYGLLNSSALIRNMTLASSVLSYHLTGLKNSTVYFALISAVLSPSLGEMSSIVYFLTGESSLLVSAMTSSPTSAHVNWTRPSLQMVSSYEVQYIRVEDNVGNISITSNTSILLRDLLPNSTYCITVTPLINGTRGNPGFTAISMPHEVSAKATPSPLHLTVSEIGQGVGLFLVTWQPPEVPVGTILHYNVSVQANGSSTAWYYTDNPYLYLQDFLPNTVYNISVTAVGENGESLQSDTAMVQLQPAIASSSVSSFKPQLLSTEELSIRSSSILLKLPECGVFEKAARQLPSLSGQNLSVSLVVAESKAVNEDFKLASSTLTNLTYKDTNIGSTGPYVSIHYLSAYDCYSVTTNSRIIQRDTESLCGPSTGGCEEKFIRARRSSTFSIRPVIVGATEYCNSSIQVCNGPLRSNTGYRTKYILVDGSGNEVMSSYWSDTFKTKSGPIPYEAIELRDRATTAGVVILAVLLLFLFLLLLLLCFLCLGGSKRRNRKMYKQATPYDTHHTKDIVMKNSMASEHDVREPKILEQMNGPFVIQSREQYVFSGWGASSSDFSEKQQESHTR